MDLTENGDHVFGILDGEGNQRIRAGANITNEGVFIFGVFIPPVALEMCAIPLGFYNGGIIDDN
jgi:hypothetical protein